MTNQDIAIVLIMLTIFASFIYHAYHLRKQRNEFNRLVDLLNKQNYQHAQSIIEDYAGRTDLTEKEQQRLHKAKEVSSKFEARYGTK